MMDYCHIKNYVGRVFGRFGVNKKREIERLLYEIAKRENIQPQRLELPATSNFREIKEYLLNRRYSASYKSQKKTDFYLPALEIEPFYAFQIGESSSEPKNIYIEEEVINSDLISRLKANFPKAAFSVIGSLKNHIKGKACSPADYSKRAENFYVVKEKFDFLKSCPCTDKAVGCGYYVINLGFGCPFECTYCFLQGYQNVPGIILPANPEDFLSEFQAKYSKGKLPRTLRLGSGEFTDSLALDHITEFSSLIINLFRNYPKVIFEFKTKSSNIANILKTEPAQNIVVSWSLNSQHVITQNEFCSASLQERLHSADDCVKAGYRVGFHFDPLIYHEGWEEHYQETVDLLFDSVDSKAIAWISLGTLRFNPELKKVIENRFPRNTLLDEELLLGFDGKMRYTEERRRIIYEAMLNWIRKRSDKVTVYLCMENVEMWKSLEQLQRPKCDGWVSG